MLSGITSSSSSLLAELFRTLDRDGSSGVSVTELSETTSGATGSSATMEEIFAALDADADGEISQVEFTSAFEQLTTAAMHAVLEAQESRSELDDGLLNAMDSNRDGSVSEAEFTAYVEEQTGVSSEVSGAAAERLFAELDLNDDGAVDAAEITSFQANATAVMSEVEIGVESGEGTESAPPPPPPPSGDGDESESYDPLDTNQDGVVSAAERAAAGIDIMA